MLRLKEIVGNPDYPRPKTDTEYKRMWKYMVYCSVQHWPFLSLSFITNINLSTVLCMLRHGRVVEWLGKYTFLPCDTELYLPLDDFCFAFRMSCELNWDDDSIRKPSMITLALSNKSGWRRIRPYTIFPTTYYVRLSVRYDKLITICTT